MDYLYQELADKVKEWREKDYDCPEFSAIGEILDWCRGIEEGSTPYLRHPQIRALETYWYLRLICGTPHIFDLYKSIYSKSRELREAFGLNQDTIRDFVEDEGIGALWERIRTDDDFVRDFKLQSIRETLTLDYPSYIFALAMGAGKTVLIAAIIATEFGMALEYPEKSFVRNALVFAPGKTIIESLRELAEVPYGKILPPRIYKPFSATIKLTFTRDGEKDIPVIQGSSYNVIVTNTEKIRIQKETIRKSDLGKMFSDELEEAAKAEVANLRLQSIASLPDLAVFSDEAHHTYGQSLDTGLKKVRKTVDYLAKNTNVIAVVNTTGTPYYNRQPLKDVVIWYGLSRGIDDGYLKELSGNIQAYNFDGDARAYVEHVVKDFFGDYSTVALPNGALSKLAIYFPQTDDLKELRPVVDQALMSIGQTPAVCLVNTSDSDITSESDIRAFNDLNNPGSPYRVMLLVNKGTEGWNCPSLFACALARKLSTSNNFVLQAASRCLRQVPGNTMKARVYLSSENFGVLDRQLQDTYGESISELNSAGQETRRAKIILRKLDIPPLVVTKIVRTVVRRKDTGDSILLKRPRDTGRAGLERKTYTLAEQQATSSVLRQVGDTVVIETPPEFKDAYSAAVELASRYRINMWLVYDEIRRLYSQSDVPLSHIDKLAQQIEDQTRNYETREEHVDIALALVKPEGFAKETDAQGTEIYTAEIVYNKDREHLLLSIKDLEKHNPGGFGFHYTPYDFDSNPEKSLFETILTELNLIPKEIEDIYFTGALTDPAKTDFAVEYHDTKGKWRRYTPDFVIRKKPKPGCKKGTGRVYIVEVKSEHDRDHPIDGAGGIKEMAVRKWTNINPDRLRYEMIFTATDIVPADSLGNVKQFIQEKE